MNITNLSIKTTKKKVPIILNLSFSAQKGELLAILGPSGSGKTTVLSAITRNAEKGLTYSGYLKTVGSIKYVAQEDFLHGFYTVSEYLKLYITLNYGKLDKNFRNQIIRRTAELTGLTSSLKTRVGDVFYKGLSGGQKRRLSIALELISKPDILVLDEPTSGLDSAAALNLIEVLKRLTKEGICVVCTLHQPSSQIWNLLDKVIFLSKGYTCYSGITKQARPFFESLGHAVPENYNPPDYYILQINSDFNPCIKPEEINKKYEDWASHHDLMTITEEIAQDNQKQLNDLPEANGRQDCTVVENQDKFALFTSLATINKRARGFHKTLLLCERNLVNNLKNPGILGIRLLMYTVLSFMVGFLYFHLGNHFTQKDIVSRTSLLFYVAAFLVFMSIAVLPFFMMERAIVTKECRNHLYKPIHYQIARFVTSLPGIALIAILSTILVVLPAKLNGFGIFFMILLLALIVAESLAMLVSLLVPHYIIGMALIAGIYGMFMLCEGFLIVKSDIPGYFIWVYYIAFHTYTFKAFMYNEFHSIPHFDSDQFSSGYDVLVFYSMENTWIWECAVILIAYTIILEIFSFFVMQLRFRKRKTGLKENEVPHAEIRPNQIHTISIAP